MHYEPSSISRSPLNKLTVVVREDSALGGYEPGNIGSMEKNVVIAGENYPISS